MQSRSLDRIRRTLVLLPGLLLTLALAACDQGMADGVGSSEARPYDGVIDSIFPIEEEIRRFREGMAEVSELRSGHSSREALVDGFLAALTAADTVGVLGLALTREEFAWLYYPHTMYTSPPYELSPALVWFQQQNRSSVGLQRLLRRYAGQPLHTTGFNCPDEGEAFGEGRIWHGCRVTGQLPTGESVSEQLFGSILEVGGRYKFVSWSNEL